MIFVRKKSTCGSEKNALGKGERHGMRVCGGRAVGSLRDGIASRSEVGGRRDVTNVVVRVVVFLKLIPHQRETSPFAELGRNTLGQTPDLVERDRILLHFFALLVSQTFVELVIHGTFHVNVILFYYYVHVH